MSLKKNPAKMADFYPLSDTIYLEGSRDSGHFTHLGFLKVAMVQMKSQTA